MRFLEFQLKSGATGGWNAVGGTSSKLIDGGEMNNIIKICLVSVDRIGAPLRGDRKAQNAATSAMKSGFIESEITRFLLT